MSAAERLIRYCRINTQSDPASGMHPSASREFELANMLVDEKGLDVYWGYDDTSDSEKNVLTAEYISDFDDTDNIVVAPNIAEIEKEDNSKNAKINVSITNNYEGTLSEIVILGKIPFENNTYVINKENLGSKFTANMTGKISIPEDLKNYATVYYSEKEDTNRDLTDANNNWKLDTEVSDWSKIRTYLIDLGDYVFPTSENKIFTYEVTVPGGLGYNSVSFSHHAVYYYLDTQNGKLEVQTEPNKVGIQVVGKYNIELLKNRKGEDNTYVQGAVFELKTTDVDGKEVTEVATTNANGFIAFRGIHIDQEYVLTEISTPNNYKLLEDSVKFKLEVENNNATFNVLEGEFKNTPQLEIGDDGYYVAKVQLENEPRYNLEITKNKINDNTLFVKGATYQLTESENTSNTIKGMTDINGKVTLNGLYLNKEYKLKEISVNNDYVVAEGEIVFEATQNAQGNIEIIVNSSNGFKGTPVITRENGIDIIKVNLEDEAKYSLKIKKLGDNEEKLQGVKFELEENGTKQYLKTNSNGEVTASGLIVDKTYKLIETKAEDYYVTGVAKSFKVTRDNTGKLVMQSTDAEMARAVITESAGVAQATVSVEIENEKIPTYNLQIIKVEEDNDEDDLTQLTKLKNAKFVIKSTDKNEEKEYVTDQNGLINVTNLYQYVQGKNITGEYKIQETEAPEGYANFAEEISLVVSKNTSGNLEANVKNQDSLETYKGIIIDGNTVKLILQNRPLFKLKKVDSETGEALKNVEFIIYKLDNDGNKVDYAKDIHGNYVGTQNDKGNYVVVTDDNGEISLPLEAGNYKAVEVKTPEGYIDNATEEYFKIENNNVDEQEEESTNYDISARKQVSINYIEDLVEVSNNMATNENYYNGYVIKLERDLDFESADSYRSGTVNTDLIKNGTGTGFKPIAGRFHSVFDGQNHEIKNIYIAISQDFVGLFEELEYATVKNLGITGKIEDTNGVHQRYVGGIAGNASASTIYNCHSNIEISHSETYCDIGGILGNARSQSIVQNCYSTGNIVNTNYGSTTGIVGLSSGARIYGCYNTGNISGKEHVAGIVVCNVSDTYIENCYNTGNLQSESTIAGICSTYSNNTITLKNNYNTGNVTSNSNTAGAITAYDSTVNSENNYYLETITVSGRTIFNYGTEVSDSYMKSQEFVNNLNSDGVWEYNENGYPKLNVSDGLLVKEINYIEDLIDFQKLVDSSVKYDEETVKLMRTLDFEDDSCYRNPNDTSYGDLNGDGNTDSLKDELINDGFTPIGTARNMSFRGIFDGQGYEIKNAHFKQSGDNIGLFGTIEYATIINLGVNSDITTGKLNAGGIAGLAKGDCKIINCYNLGDIINNIENDSSNKATSAGLIGYGYEHSNIEFLDCYNKGDISGNYNVAGLNAYQYNGNTKVVNSYNTGKITGKYDGALIAYKSGGDLIMTDCWNTGNIEGLTYGGMIGYGYTDTTEISRCYNTGNNTGYNAGGIAGYIRNATVIDCYNTGDIGMYEAGGIVGYLDNSTISNCYNLGNATSIENNRYAGGIVSNEYNECTIENCYYSDNATIVNRINSNCINEKGTKLSDDYMKTEEFYNTLNVNDVWKFVQNNYPILSSKMPYNLVASTEIVVENEIKKFNITTEVKNGIGGTISGEGETPYEQVKYGNANENEIVMTPDSGYKIIQITINGENVKFGTLGEEDTYTIPSGYFENMTEDKHIVVTYTDAEKLMNIKKVDKDDNGITLQGAKFEIRKQDKEMLSSMGKYGSGERFVEDNGIFVSNNTNVASSKADGFIYITPGKTGKCYVEVDASISSEAENDYGYATIGTGMPNSDEEGINIDRFFKISGEVEKKTYKSEVFTLNGTTNYFVNFGYVKNDSVDSGEDQFKIYSVRLFFIDDETTVETNENGNAEFTFVPGTYYIKETQAPEGYILDDTVHAFTLTAESEKEIELQNKKQPKLTVHHYLKGTTNKVALDENYIGNLGDNYSTSPKIDLKSLTLEKDSDGKYVIPTNASGKYTDESIEVTYFYEVEPITLTIHHYLDGTESKLVEDEIVETDTTIEFTGEAEYTVTTDANYTLNTNSNYNNLTRSYNLTSTTSTIQDDTTIEDILEYAEDSEISYYYETKEYEYSVHYFYDGVEDEEKVETVTLNEATQIDEYIDKNEDGYRFDRAKALDSEGKEVDLPLQITDNTQTNVINVYYVKNNYAYEVHYFYDGNEDTTKTENYLAYVGTQISTYKDKNKDGYKLDKVEVPSAEDQQLPLVVGNDITKNIINVYYVRKDTSVLVHHYIDNTTTQVPSKTEGLTVADELIEGQVFDEYETSASDKISNKYELVETKLPANAEGTMEEEQIVVTYYYKLKDAKVTVKYLEKGTNEVLDTEEEIDGKVDDPYTTVKKTVENYTFVEDTENTTGTMTVNPIEVIYYYLQNTSAKVEYIDKTTDEILDERTEEGLVGDIFETTAQDFENYILVEEPEEKSVPMEKEEIVLKYYYIHIAGGVLEKHIDIITNEILDNDAYEGNEGDEYEILPKEFEGYDLVEEKLPENSKGTMTVEPIEVKYYYIRKAKVEVEYKDVLTEEKLTEDELIEGHEKDQYETEEKEFEGYDLVEVPENSKGTMEKDTIKVTYYYIKKSAGVIERHYDITTNELLEKETKYTGHVEDEYKTKAKTFKGYDIVEEKLPENAEGKMTEEEIIVNYYYLKKSTVIVRYVDKETGKEIIVEDIIKGHVGDEYKTKPEEIEGYKLVTEDLPGNIKGNMTEDEIEVIYYYQKIQEENNKNEDEEPEQEQKQEEGNTEENENETPSEDLETSKNKDNENTTIEKEYKTPENEVTVEEQVVETQKNPYTGDNIVKTVMIFMLSIVLIVLVKILSMNFKKE